MGFSFIEHRLGGAIVVAPETENTDAPGAETPGLFKEVIHGAQCDAPAAMCAAFMVAGDVVPQAVKQFPEGGPLYEPQITGERGNAGFIRSVYCRSNNPGSNSIPISRVRSSMSTPG